MGTQTKIASAAARSASSGEQHAQAASERGRQAVVRDVVDRGGAGVELLDPAGVRVDALDLQAGLHERDGQRQADVAQADHGHSTVLGHDPSSDGRARGYRADRGRARGTGRARAGEVLPFAAMSATSEAPAAFRHAAARPGPLRLIGEAIEDIRSRRRLVRYLVQADIKKKGADTFLGNLWWVLDPLLQMGVYVVFVSLILDVKTPDYPLFILSAILPWKWFTTQRLATRRAPWSARRS